MVICTYYVECYLYTFRLVMIEEDQDFLRPENPESLDEAEKEAPTMLLPWTGI